jgi:hypothetical protein
MTRTFLLAIAVALVLAIAVALVAGCAHGDYVGDRMTNPERRKACEPSTWALRVPGYVRYVNVGCNLANTTGDQAPMIPTGGGAHIQTKAPGQ